MKNERIDRLVEKELMRHRKFVSSSMTAKQYYRNENDIKRTGGFGDVFDKMRLKNNPLRCSDYRISHNWHNLLVNQKASYLFTYAPVFDVGCSEMNNEVALVLGDDFGKKVKDLCVEASNSGVGWLFLWTDEENNLKINTMESEQIVPIMSCDLEEEIGYILRYYEDEDEDGRTITRYELWDNEKVEIYECMEKCGISTSFNQGEFRGEYYHQFGRVPFIPFFNNDIQTGDLMMYKDLIDQYDKVVSGYANDLEDIQEIIFVIKNYGGEDLGVFLNELKKYKAIKVDGDNGESGVETMQIDIPVEARKEFLKLLKNQIFISGHGVYPDHDAMASTSGVALKYMYSLLEIKAGLMEVEFKSGFAKLVRMILRHIGVAETVQIKQTFIRNSIENDSEVADMCQKSKEFVSRETILKNHPWVLSVEDEIEKIKREEIDIAKSV